MPLVDSNPPLTVPISLDQLEMGMVPLHSVQIEEIEADGTATKVMCRLYCILTAWNIPVRTWTKHLKNWSKNIFSCTNAYEFPDLFGENFCNRVFLSFLWSPSRLQILAPARLIQRPTPFPQHCLYLVPGITVDSGGSMPIWIWKTRFQIRS